jgi:MFS family permease
MWGTNSLYIINMPLFIIDELHLSEKLAGIMMGTAAGLEIPTMLIAGYYAKRFGKRFLMRIAAVAGLLFYIGMLTVHASVAACFTAAERDLYRDPRRDWDALLSGSYAGSGGLSNNPIPIPPAWAGSLPVQWPGSLPKSGTITRCSGLRW